jgi:hypothetical protein
MKYDFAFCAVGDARKKGIFYTFLKFEILYSGIEVSVAHPKFSDHLIFRHCLSCGTWGAIWPVLRTAGLDYLIR